MNVLITGANGFVGRNLCAYLEASDLDMDILRFDVDNTTVELKAFLQAADAVVHLAGVNRPEHEEEFVEGNVGLIRDVVQILINSKRSIPIVLSSSIQAERDNAYGRSKKDAEDIVRTYEKDSGAPCYIYRLSNVFGKWCRPNYNSVVATWCHHIARDREIQISDPANKLELVYVIDVVEAFVGALEGRVRVGKDGYCHVPASYRTTLGELEQMLRSFRASRETLVMPNLQDAFAAKLYATYLSYLPEDRFAYELDMKRDDRGWLAEFIKSKEQGQIFISCTKPGITRGNHWHHTKVEKFLVVQGEAMISFRRVGSDEVIEYFVSGDKLTVLDIPTGYTHLIENIGEEDVLTLFWAGEMFDPRHPDTYYTEVYSEV